MRYGYIRSLGDFGLLAAAHPVPGTKTNRDQDTRCARPTHCGVFWERFNRCRTLALSPSRSGSLGREQRFASSGGTRRPALDELVHQGT